jgi:hypothetical protein
MRRADIIRPAFLKVKMNLRIKVAALFTLSLLSGYATGVYTTEKSTRDSIQKAQSERDQALGNAAEIQERLNSLCGDAVLKFIPCQKGLEVCVCGTPDKYLTDR